MSPCTSAVAATRLSFIGIVRPEDRNRASSSAHRRPVSASQGRQCKLFATASNQTSKPFAFPSSGQNQYAEPKLSENHGINGEVALVTSEPADSIHVRRRFRGLAQNISVDEEPHSRSVDSDSTGTKNPFSGHCRSRSTSPSFRLVGRRTRRYSPRRTRSTSNCCPALIRSSRRNSAGSTICPFEEILVIIEVRLRLTKLAIKRATRSPSTSRPPICRVPPRLPAFRPNRGRARMPS